MKTTKNVTSSLKSVRSNLKPGFGFYSKEEDVVKDFVKSSDTPAWYRGMSEFQLNAADNLLNALRDDREQDTSHRVYSVLTTLGLHPIIKRSEIRLLMMISRGSDLAFLWFLKDIYYKSKDGQYNINEQLIMSSIAHLDLQFTLRGLQNILPPGQPPKNEQTPETAVPTEMPKDVHHKHPQKEKLSKKIKAFSDSTFRKNYELPYFKQLVKPRPYGKSLHAKLPEYNLKMKYADMDEHTVIPNEANRWFGRYELSTGKRMASCIIRDNLIPMVFSTAQVERGPMVLKASDIVSGDKKTQAVIFDRHVYDKFVLPNDEAGQLEKERSESNNRALCEHHKMIDEVEQSLAHELNVTARDKILNHFNPAIKGKEKRIERVRNQIEQDVALHLNNFHRLADKSRKTSYMQLLYKDQIYECDTAAIHNERISPSKCGHKEFCTLSKEQKEKNLFNELGMSPAQKNIKNKELEQKQQRAQEQQRKIRKLEQEQKQQQQKIKMKKKEQQLKQQQKLQQKQQQEQQQKEQPEQQQEQQQEQQKKQQKKQQQEKKQKEQPEQQQEQQQEQQKKQQQEKKQKKKIKTKEHQLKQLQGHEQELQLNVNKTKPLDDISNMRQGARRDKKLDSCFGDGINIADIKQPDPEFIANRLAQCKAAHLRRIIQGDKPDDGYEYIKNYDYGHNDNTDNGDCNCDFCESDNDGDSDIENSGFFKAPKKHLPYNFNYEKIFNFPEEAPRQEDTLRCKFLKALNSGLNLNVKREANSDIDAAVKRYAIKTFKTSTRNYNEQMEAEESRKSSQKKTMLSFQLDYYDPEDEELMCRMLTEGLQILAKDPRYVLPSMPDSAKYPILVYWMYMRYGRTYTQKQLEETFKKSLPILFALKRLTINCALPSGRSLGPALFVQYSCRDYLVSKTNHIRKAYYKYLDKAIMEQSRCLYMAMNPHLCVSGLPNTTYFAYMPARVSDIHHFHVWRPTEYRNGKDAHARRMVEARRKQM